MPRIMFSIIAASELAKSIKAIGTRKVALDKAVQDAAAQCIAQSIVHRNATPAMQLFEVLANSVRRDALVVYLEKFGNLGWNKSEKKLAFRDNGFAFEANSEELTAHMEVVVGTAWYSLKKEPEVVSVFDAEDLLGKTIDRINKAIKRGATVVHRELASEVEQVLRKHQAAELQKVSAAEQNPELKQALDERAAGRATPAMLAKLTEHFGRPIEQIRKAA
ncbi:MAG TPA: hypothetical protein VEA41_12210 [Salinarimonas sp.]|nr:hypothetical protein [Salinarimonas sp.]